MQVVSLNIAQPEWVDAGEKRVLTGIFKKPADGARPVRRLGIDGDGQADLVHHGGEDKAVYGYPHEHYARWADELGRDDFAMGQFGENLTTNGLLEADLCIGDTVRAGTALLQVSQPRVPCAKLGIRMGDRSFVRRFLESLRTGFYFRVLEEGAIRAGDALSIASRDTDGFSVRDIMHLHFFDKLNRAQLDRALALPALSASWKESLTALRNRLD